MPKTLHIVSFDVPSPPDYGGAIDVYYKLKALNELGVEIILHCFEYGRKPSAELEKLCQKIYTYKRDNSRQKLFNFMPFIVVSRSNEKLLENLLSDDAPILFEGLHCCYFLNSEKLKNRTRVVRTHNVEHDYYRHLAAAESSIFKRFYFEMEAGKLASFEVELSGATALAAISPADTSHFASRNENTLLVPAFHPNTEVSIKPGRGKYCLYHGSLSIGENNKAALWLINEVFNELDVPLVIAGNNPSPELKNAIKQHKHISLKNDVSTQEIYTLLQDAQVNVLPTFQTTGIKLKLLAALFSGRHCVVNKQMVENTGLESLCRIAGSAAEMKKLVIEAFSQPFDLGEISARKAILEKDFSNKANAEKLLGLF